MRNFLLPLLLACSGATNQKDTGELLDQEPSQPASPTTEPSNDSASDGLQLNELLSKSEFDVLDWVELKNSSEQSMDLSGYQLTDDYGQDTPWAFPEGSSIAPGEFVIVWADGTGASSESEFYADFKLSAGGETLTLLDPDGVLIEEIEFPELVPDTSYGRVEDGSAWDVFLAPTPGTTNGAGQ